MSKFIQVTGSYTHETVYVNVNSILSIYDKKAYTPRILSLDGHDGSSAAILQCTGADVTVLFVEETAKQILAQIDPPPMVEIQPPYPKAMHAKNEELARETNRLLKEYAEKKRAPTRIEYPFGEPKIINQ
jgi:hypothetical protein